jgi:TonB-linked SusC/RagA family outer membrane protein
MRHVYAACASALAALLLLGAPLPVLAQSGAITGTITDGRSGQPVAGVQVTVAQTSVAALTNADGRYALQNVPAGTVEIRTRHLGYSPQSQTVTLQGGQALTLNFQLDVAAIALDEVVATGYAQQTRRQVSSSISSVSATDMGQRVVASLDAALAGKAPGIQVIQNAGNPGNAITVRVRGSASISASNQPLYIVDGMPVFREDFGQLGLGGQDLSAITGLNPDEIESIDILKDAAAASIYGSRGSNGVVLITTRRGRSGAPQFELDLSVGNQDLARRPRFLNRDQWIQYFSEAMRNDGYDEQDILDELDELGVNNYPGVDTDWLSEVTRSAPLRSAQLSLSGGLDRFRYFVSASRFDQTGVVIGTEYARTSGRINLDLQATDRLSLNASLALSHEDNDRVESDNSIVSVVTNAYANEPWVPVRNPDGSFNFHGSYSNPVAVGSLNSVNATTNRILGNVSGTYGFTGWLQGTTRVGVDVLNLREFRYDSPDVLLSYASGVGGVSRIGNSAGRKTVLEGFMNASRVFGAHDVSGTAGASVEATTRESSFLRGEGFTSPDLHWPANAARPVSIHGTMWDHRLISYFSRATYTLLNRYVMNASLRADGSSRFGPNNRFGVFPSFAAAWIVSEEDFMEFGPISSLRIRGSLGLTGNEAIGNFQYLGLFGTSNYGDTPGIAPSNLPNPDLQWEQTREWNLGFDVAFLDDRFGIVAEIYNKTTDDLLLNRPITGTSGFTSVLDNVGTIENKGWELELRSVNIRSDRAGGLEWTSQLNLTHNQNRVTKLAGDDEPFNTGYYQSNRVEVGHPLGAFHMNRFEGVDPATGDALYTQLDADGNRIGTTTSPTADDRMIVGSPHPDYYGGLSNSVSFGSLDVSAFLEFSFGGEIYNAMRRFADDGGYYYDNKFVDVLDYWTPENPNASNPRPSYFGRSGARLNSSRLLEDASYVRLQEVTVGYQLPQTLAARAGMSRARLYVSGRNIHTWTDYSGYSPDVNSGGASSSTTFGTDFYTYPIARAFTIGFQGTW